MVHAFCAAVAATVAAADPAFAATHVARVTEPAAYQQAGRDGWRKLSEGDVLNPGDKLRTGRGGKATLVFADDSQVEIGPNSTFLINDVDQGKTTVELAFGFLRAFVAHIGARQFRVRTPTSVCAVRGTEFSVGVDQAGQTRVQMFSGVLAVADTHGNETLIKDHQSIQVTDRGLGPVGGAGRGGNSPRAQELKEQARREVGLEMSKEQVEAAAAEEARNAVYQEGKAIIDVNGHRVRIEEYIVRPTPTDFKLVVLNERADRFDYFFYHGTFNTTLPDDLSVALRQLPGCIDAKCSYYLTGFDTGRSNTIDNMLEVAKGGHQVDVNNNGAGLDANGNPVDGVTAAYDPATDKFTQLNIADATFKNLAPNQSFFHTLYDYDTLTFNGVAHNGWIPTTPAASVLLGGAGIQTMGGGATGINSGSVLTDMNNLASAASPATLTTVDTNCAPPNCTYNEAGVMHQVVYAHNADGSSWDKYDSYIISDEGKIANASAFSGITSGSSYKSTLLNWNFEQVVTSSEFHGRKIDLAVEPKIFIESGLIP